ncbi:GNAT family N-acetyltransferase [Actinomadura sp. HBU206391]|uniref:GNAT family N-acetyltransferase n=1 Tax=Actinomadura sp. HBU206391 TaxID=2731692 RepID=UPI00164F33DA|nr:GNAT family N-acetyltransferase [Actinomadura sp. HBU206391]MBC6461420.1 N-acetyltransferase [Actinomadura sp. HBU206391]
MALRIIDVPDQKRFEVYEGEELAGFLDYRLRGDDIALLHTEVDPRFDGRGIGSRLVREALDASRDTGLGVLPYCPFIRDWISRHADYLDLVPEDRRAEFKLSEGTEASGT